MKAKAKGINLLPKEYIKEQKIKLYKQIGAVVVALEAVCFVAFIAVPPKQELKQTQQTLDEKRAIVTSERYAGVSKTLEELDQARAEMASWQEAYSQIKHTNYISGELLDELVSIYSSNEEKSVTM